MIQETKILLSDSDRTKANNDNDSLFYLVPRFTFHLDDTFRRRLTDLYKDQISSSSDILDLMSSWVSHLPKDIKYNSIVGHGLNEDELRSNKRLDKYWIQDLNTDQKLPLPDSSIDVCLVVAGWQYLQYPEAIANELFRIVRPEGKLIVSFTNRAFWEKAPKVWTNSTSHQHLHYISSVLQAHGWSKIQFYSEEDQIKTIFGLFSTASDPFYSVIASRTII